MFRKKPLALAITLTSLSASPAYSQIEEVIVTATKRPQSLQDVPVAVSAIQEETLDQLGVSNFEDYLLQLPNVTAGGSGPGQNTIYIRGVASTTPGLTTAGVAGLAPNVALYLDEQPLAQPGRNLDVYAADLARVEVLSGPQGTLFGASSQAGTVRLITNKPDPSATSAKMTVGTAWTKSGEMSNNVEAVVNLPVSDSLTLRGVVFVDNQGGYIDNVPGTLNLTQSGRFRAAGTVRANGVPVSSGRAGFQSTSDLSGVTFLDADNGAQAEDNFNDAVYSGARLTALWEFSPDWSLTVAHMRQNVEADGVFFADPTVGDLAIQRYENDRLEDSFNNTNWTLEGRIGELETIYTGAFTDREADQMVDYADYMFVGQYLPYYVCDGSVTYPSGDPSGTCQAPNMFVNSLTETDVNTHELRFSTDSDSAIRATFGGFYSDLELREVNSFTYLGSRNAVAFNGATGFGPNFSAQGANVKYPGQWPDGVIFRNDVLRTDEQQGLFGEVTVDLNDSFSLLLGARWFDISVDLQGSAAGSFGNFGATQDNNAGNNLDQLFSAPNPDTASTDGTITKFGLNWTPNSDQLLYFTFSEGFRPGLLTRPGGATNPAGTFSVPFAVDTDDLTNLEIGWKTDLLDNRLRFNAAVYWSEIERLQTTIFDPSITNLFFSDNAADADVTGFEGDLIWAPATIQGLTVTGAFSFLDTEITRVITPTDDVRLGDPLAFAPEFQLNLRARYEWDLGGGRVAHIMPHVTHSDEAYSDIITINRDRMSGWTMWGVTGGISVEQWSAEFFIDNLTDERAELARSFIYDRQRVTYARPFTAGMRLRYDF
ncbi:MAG: TonB-dependent receptor [Gammaproteobacteria bacterium TMED107]|nr:TonB-dependent receptor [Gammaproteobacteria bacterium]OUX72610.1 MAG: TonB-dependent receptor [Gammaproteobacteria bacterium TMED107]